MKKPTLPIMKKSPEKIQNKLIKETEYINKQIENLKKKEAEPEYFEFFSNQLTKLKNPIQIWIRSNVFDSLGMAELSNLYKSKADELGYCVENLENDENLNFETEETVEESHTTEAPTKLRSIWVKYSDGTEYTTNMAAHLTDQEMLDYFAINKVFNLGKGEDDHMVKVVDRKIVESVITENKWDGKLHTYKSKNGHTCIEALDEETSKALDEFFVNFKGTVANENKETTNEGKEVFQSAPDTINGNIRTFYDNIDKDAKKPEYDQVALRYLINGDNFLKFAYHNLSTGDVNADLDMMYKQYVKGEEAYVNQLKTFESLVATNYSTVINSNEQIATIMETLNTLNIAIDKDATIAALCNIVNDMAISVPKLKESFLLSSVDNKKQAISKMLENNIETLTNIFLNKKSEDIQADIKQEINADFTADLLTNCIDEAIHIVSKHAWMGNKEASAITAIVASMLAKQTTL